MRATSIVAFTIFATAILLQQSCVVANPEFCCATDEQCNARGVDELRPCETGQACKDFVCIAKECDTSADCTSPEAPRCLNNLCVAGCQIDDDCLGVPGASRCDTGDGACVGCVSPDQCPAEAAICDTDTRSCRGCTGDDECSSAVCIEADGVCATDDEIVYVTSMGLDAGLCTKAAPCATISFAFSRVTATKRVIRILGGTLNTGTNPITLGSSVILDGSNTFLESSASPVFSIAANRATIEGVSLPVSTLAVRVGTGGMVRLVDAGLEGGQLVVTAGGSLEVSEFALVNGTMSCTDGDVIVRRARIDRSSITTDNCELAVSASHLGPGFETIGAAGGLITIENSLFVETFEGNNLLRFYGNHAPGSTFRFNTVVNTSPVQSTGAGISCDETMSLTSNIIAYNSTFPLSPLCIANQSLFDAPGAQISGEGNTTADVITFFEDRSNGDFHLSMTSPALGLGEPGLVDTDFDGNSRPSPTGSQPDLGAFEAP